MTNIIFGKIIEIIYLHFVIVQVHCIVFGIAN